MYVCMYVCMYLVSRMLSWLVLLRLNRAMLPSYSPAWEGEKEEHGLLGYRATTFVGY